MHTSDTNAWAVLTPWPTCLQVRATCEGLRQASPPSTIISLLLLRRVGSGIFYLQAALPVQILPTGPHSTHLNFSLQTFRTVWFHLALSAPHCPRACGDPTSHAASPNLSTVSGYQSVTSSPRAGLCFPVPVPWCLAHNHGRLTHS